MKIALFTDSYHPGVNGITFVVDILYKNLTKLGHEVYIVAPKPGLSDKHIPKNISQKSIIWIPAIEGFFEDSWTSVFSPSRTVKKLEKLDIDIVLFFTPGQIGLLGAYLAKRNNLPLIQQYSTDLFEYVKEYPSVISGVIALTLTAPIVLKMSKSESVSFTKQMLKARAGESHTWRQDYVRRALNELHNRCDNIIAVSAKSAQKLRAEGVVANISIIPNGVDKLPANLATVKKYRSKYKIADNEIVILYVGRIAKEKNLDMLLRAFEILASNIENVRLLFVGDYEYKTQLETKAMASSSSSKIVFLGNHEREDLGNIYTIGDIFAFPSTTDTQGLAINEAALAGLPIVWCDDGVNDIAIDGESGLLAKPNAKDFANKLLMLCENESLRKKMGLNASKYANKMTEIRQTKKLEHLLLDELTKR